MYFVTATDIGIFAIQRIRVLKTVKRIPSGQAVKQRISISTFTISFRQTFPLRERIQSKLLRTSIEDLANSSDNLFRPKKVNAKFVLHYGKSPGWSLHCTPQALTKCLFILFLPIIPFQRPVEGSILPQFPSSTILHQATHYDQATPRLDTVTPTLTIQHCNESLHKCLQIWRDPPDRAPPKHKSIVSCWVGSTIPRDRLDQHMRTTLHAAVVSHHRAGLIVTSKWPVWDESLQ